MRPNLALAALAAATLLLPDTRAQAGPPPWNRHAETMGIVPTPGQPGHYDISAVWTVQLGGPTSTLLKLDTEIALRINGVEVDREFASVMVSPLSGNCGACAPGCGDGAVNGIAMSMLCLSDGPAGCSCQFPFIKADFGDEELEPGDEIIIVLLPPPGSLPEFDTGDDAVHKLFVGPLFWDRQLVKAEAKPSSGGSDSFFDLHVDWTLGSVGVLEPMLVSPQFVVSIDGFEKFVYVGPCGPWILAPSSGCTPCTGANCATITCNGQVVSTSICEESPNGAYCGCFSSELFHVVIPGIKLSAGQKLTVGIQPVPGTLPELPPIGDDELDVASPFGTWKDLGHALAGANGEPVQVGQGSLFAGDPLSITLSGALAGAPAYLIAGGTLLEHSFKGGVMVPDPSPPALLLGLVTGPTGKIVLNATWPAGLPSGFSLYLQWWIDDAAGPKGFAASNALSATTP